MLIDADLDEADGAARKLKAHGSHAEAPAKKMPATDDGEVMPSWARVMQSSILSGVQGMIQNEISPIKSDIAAMKGGLETVSSKADEAMKVAGEAQKEIQVVKDTIRQTVKEEVRAIVDENAQGLIKHAVADEVQKQMRGKPMSACEGANTVVIGGMAQASLEDAKAWISQVLKEAAGPSTIDVYKKGKTEEHFKGMMFAKFACPAEAETAVTMISARCAKENERTGEGKKLWCNLDRPIQQRVAISFLFSFKKLLVQWKYEPRCIKIDTEKSTLKVAGREVLQASVTDFTFSYDWMNDDWAKWKELVASSELLELAKNAQDKLKTSQAELSKGSGKGQQ